VSVCCVQTEHYVIE